MSDRWSLGLVVAAIVCCAVPVLIAAGIAGATWALVREHWAWATAGLGLAALGVLLWVRGMREP